MNSQFRALKCGIRRAVDLGLLIAVLFSSFGTPVSKGQTASTSTPSNEHFLLYEGLDGDTICRAATLREREELDKIIPRNLQQINHTEDKAGSPGAASHGRQHLKIVLLATQSLESHALAKAAFIRAAARWENIITSPVTLYIEVDYGPTRFGQSWPTGTLGLTSSANALSVNYSVFRSHLINRANTTGKLAVYNALPENSVPTDLGTASSVVVSASIARATGFLNPTAQETDSKSMIAFNSAFTFDFDPSDGVVGRDFEAVAAHEIGHALGFTSQNDIGTTPAVWDLFRFRSGTTNQTFTSAQRIMTIGGPVPNSQFYFVPGINHQLGLSDGGPNQKTTNNADGNQSSHWKQQILNINNVYIGIMDPQLPANTARSITPEDIAALEIFGYYSNTAPPPPSPANDNFASAQTITGCSGSLTGSNLSATQESGEQSHSPDANGGSHSIWYQWQAPASGNVTFKTAGSTFDTVLAAYTGTSVGALSVVGDKSDDNSQADKTSTVSFIASAGTIYRIAVDGYNNFDAGGDVGPVTLSWSVENCATPQLSLMVAEAAALPDLSAAVDSVLLITDPFPVINSGNLISPATDRNTRVVIFVGNLSLTAGQPASSVVVNLVDSNNQSRDVAAEDVRIVPNFDFSQITFRLPDNLPAGTYKIKVVFGGKSSNTATIRVRV